MQCCFHARRKDPVKILLQKDYAIKYSNLKLKEIITTELQKEESLDTSNIDKFKSVADYPAPHIFAKLAKQAYKDKEQEKDLPENWKLLTTATNKNMNSGYFGATYWNPKQQQVVIAHRGTKIKSCAAICTDIRGIIYNNYVGQINSACTFTDWITGALNQLNEEKRVNYQLFFTGHSLGGWLAQITTFTAKYLSLNNNEFIIETANKKGFHAHAVVFDSPGCKDILNKLKDALVPRYDETNAYSVDDLDITSYLSAPNLINTRNQHIGTIYRIFVDLSDLNFIQKNTVVYNLATHKMGRILDTFHCKDVKIKQVKDWPISNGILCGKEWKNFFKWANHSNNYDPEYESYKSKLGIRYQVQDLKENISNNNVFTLEEQSFLNKYQKLRDSPYNLKLQDLFSVFNDENRKTEITERLQFFKIESNSITCQKKEELQKLISCVKTLLYAFPEIQKKIDKMSTMEAFIDSQYSYYGELVKAKFQHFTDDKELKALIKDFKQVSVVSVEEDISLGLARIYKAYIENTGRDESKDIVLRLEMLFNLKNHFYFNQTMIDFVEALSKDRSLILVKYALNFNDEDQKKFIDDFRDVFKKLKNQSETKIILVIQSISRTQELQLDLEMRKLMPPTLDNLSNEFQEKLLNKQLIVFQGHKRISLKELIRDDNEACSKIVSDPKILLALINNEDIVINIESCNRKFQSYVKRTFTYQREIKTDIFKEEKMEDLFLISGTNKEHLKSLGLAENKIRMFQENDPIKNNPIKFIIAEHHQAEENFKQLCTEFSNFNIHWLKRGPEKQICQQSHGSLINLHQYLEREVNNTERYSESDLVTKKENIIIISDTAGMGKSTVLTFLEHEIKTQRPASLVFRIDLNMYTEQLKAQKEKGGFKGRDSKEIFEKAIQFLAESLFKIDDSSKQLLFQFYCQHNIGNMIVMLDGFDEISPYYKDGVIELVQALRNGAIKQIWITTRPNMQKELENEFQQFAHALKPFSEEDQQNFLTDFWQKNLNLCDEINKDKFNTYARTLMKLLAKSISDKEALFAGIPLQTKMLAEAFMGDFDIFYKSNETVPKLQENLDLVDLYERFLEEKHKIYQKVKKELDLSKPGNIEESDKSYRNFIRKHEIMASHAIFNEEEFEHFQKKKGKLSSLMNDIEVGKLNFGLIDCIINGKAQFIHRTFAEYLVAKNLVASLESQTLAEFVLQRILIKSTYQIIRVFFNGLLKENSPYSNMSECALKNYGEQIKKLWLKNKENLYNEEGNSLLHVAAEEDNDSIARFLLKSLEKHDNHLKLSLMEASNKDKYRNNTALGLGATKGHLKISKCLVDNGASVNQTNKSGETVVYMAAGSGNLELVKYLEEKGADVNGKDNYGWTVLHQAALSGNLELVKHLVEKGVNLNAKNVDDKTVLHMAARSNNLELVKYLLEKGADENAKDNDVNTVLHGAAGSGDLELVKYLVEREVDVNVKNNDNSTVLHRAAQSGNLELVKYLVERGVDVNAKTNSDGNTVLHMAARSDNLELVKYLVEKGGDVNAKEKHDETVMHIAARAVNLKLVKYLVEKGADINAKDKYGETVLHQGAKSVNFELVKYLVEKGIDINAKNNDDNTVLLGAARFGNLELVKYLVERAVDVNAKNNDDNTVLHMAARSGKLELVKYLVERAVDVNAKNNNDDTVLHWAARSDNLELVKYLAEIVVDVNGKDKCGETVLHGAARSGKLELVKYLVEKGADVNAKNNSNGERVLHMAARSDNLELVKYLVEKGADVNAKDKYGEMVLHWAARCGILELVKYLVEKGVDLNGKNNDDNTVLHMAARSGNLELVKYFVEKGVDLNAKDNNDETMLHWAAESGNLELVEYLEEKGAPESSIKIGSAVS